MATEDVDPRHLVGLLADDDRRAVVAALALGATSVVAVREATGLDARRAGRAVSRLVDGGLVAREGRSGLVLRGEMFGATARAAAPDAPPDEHPDAPASQARVLRAFVRDGQLTSIPAARGKRLVVLDWLVQEFEPGRRYPEREVNAILRRFHPDVAALRRYLVDEEFLGRTGGAYWRIGGTFDIG